MRGILQGLSVDVRWWPDSQPEVRGAGEERADDGVQRVLRLPASSIVFLPCETGQRSL
jgi:hypothetical protein